MAFLFLNSINHTPVNSERLPFNETFLREKLNQNPGDWETRRQLAHGLYDREVYDEAAELVWTADQIPSTDLDLAFSIRILAKAQPRRAIRLLTAVLELNRGKAVQNMGMANALLHHGMVLQAARFYGAALEADPTLVNPDLEHFVLWNDDECTMWGIYEKQRIKLGQLPWMLRDPKEALKLTSRVSLHTTPIAVPELPVAAGEDLKHELYQQEAKKNAKITPPPAVTIPIDRVDPKHRLFDQDYGAAVVTSAAVVQAVEAPTPSSLPENEAFVEVVPSPIPAATLITSDESAEPTPSAPSADPFFAEPAPAAAPSEPKAVSFLGDERLTGSIKLPPPSRAPAPQLLSENEEAIAPVPAPIPVVVQPAPVPVPVPMPAPTPVPVATLVPAAASIPSPTGPLTRPLLPSGVPTGAPTRALLPSGPAPSNPTGTPTRVLLPSGTPPQNAAAPRRLLITPTRPAPAEQGDGGQG